MRPLHPHGGHHRETTRVVRSFVCLRYVTSSTLGPSHSLPAQAFSFLRFKQLLMTQADKFSPAEVRHPDPINTCSWHCGKPRG